jgi:hypothetical protein
MDFDLLSSEEKKKLLEEYPYPSRMNYDPSGGSFTEPIKTGYKADDYLYGSPEENITKSSQLKNYSKSDPAMSKRIRDITNKYVAEQASRIIGGGGTGKDMYAMAQDAYLLEMGRMGLRDAYKAKRR